MRTVLAGDLGGTKCRFALVAADFSVHAVQHVPTVRELGLGAINTNGISDPEIDKIIQEARPVLDDAKRKALLERAMELAIERHYVMPVLTFQVLSAGRTDKVSYQTRADEETFAAEIAGPK